MRTCPRPLGSRQVCDLLETLPLLVIPHPLGGLDLDSLRGRAQVATPQLVKLIEEHTH